MNTIPATEDNLRTENDVHPFDEDLPKKLEPTMHPVFVDGIKGVATTGTLGTYSDGCPISRTGTSRIRQGIWDQVLHFQRAWPSYVGPRREDFHYPKDCLISAKH